MKYSVDRIENNVVIFQNLETREIYEEKLDRFPENIKEGDIVAFSNEKYIIDNTTIMKRKKSLRERLERLKKLK